MSIAGAYRLGPESGRLLVRTTRTGLGAKAGHDLTIEVTRWHGHATVDTAVPADSSVTIQVDVGSFQVRQGTGGVKPLTDTDRAEIHKTLKQVHHTAQHPTITVRSSRVDGSAASFACDGELTIMGVTHPVALQGRVTDGRGQPVLRRRLDLVFGERLPPSRAGRVATAGRIGRGHGPNQVGRELAVAGRDRVRHRPLEGSYVTRDYGAGADRPPRRS